MALYKQGHIDSVKGIDENLKDVMDERAYSILCRRLQLELNISEGQVMRSKNQTLFSCA